jgi:DNA-binding HxlR family transcriptional regulator
MNQAALINLGENNRVLSSRERGRVAADRIADALSERSVVISFGGVEIATPSYLDEIVSRLSGLLRGNEDRTVLITGANEEVAESLELVLDKRKMALARVERGQLELLGGSGQLKKTLAAATKLGSFTAPDLAKELGLKLPNLHQRLKELLDTGAVSREVDESVARGKRHRYDTPAEPEALISDGS